MNKVNLKNFLTIILPIFLLFAAISIAAVPSVEAHDKAYDTTSYNVNMVVNEDNSMMVTETITVDFKESSHGIYRYISQEGKVRYTVNGEETEQDRAMKIDKVNVEGYDFTTETDGGNFVVRIGNEDETVKGKQVYQLSYRCRLLNDGIADYDIFYFNVLPAMWETPIDSAVINIRMPKSFDPSGMEVFCGSSESSNDLNMLSVKTSGKNISIKSKQQLPENWGVAVKQLLPDGYFVKEMTMSWAYIAIFVVSIFSALLAVLLWMRFGKDDPLVEPVELRVPEGLPPAELGYVIDGIVDSKDVVSMIFYFAEKGYIEIQETGKKDFVLRRLKPLPKDVKAYEVTIMDGIFRGPDKDESVISELKNRFHVKYRQAVSQIEKEYTENEEKRLFTKSGDLARIISGIAMVLPVFVGIFLGKIYTLAQGGLVWGGVTAGVLLLLYMKTIHLYDKRISLSHRKYRIKSAIHIVVLGLALSACIGFIQDTVGTLPALVAVSCSVAGFICTRQMQKLTPYGAEIRGRLLGFKHFIAAAEVEKLQLLVEENPNYFYNILPYAYVFGLSDKWAEKFQFITVQPPAWYRNAHGGDTFTALAFMHSFSLCAASIKSSVSIPDVDGLGGFSGGSDLSGGGFGGGGGGSW